MHKGGIANKKQVIEAEENKSQDTNNEIEILKKQLEQVQKEKEKLLLLTKQSKEKKRKSFDDDFPHPPDFDSKSGYIFVLINGGEKVKMINLEEERDPIKTGSIAYEMLHPISPYDAPEENRCYHYQTKEFVTSIFDNEKSKSNARKKLKCKIIAEHREARYKHVKRMKNLSDHEKNMYKQKCFFCRDELILFLNKIEEFGRQKLEESLKKNKQQTEDALRLEKKRILTNACKAK